MSEERAQYGEAEPLAQHTPGPWEARLLCADGEIVRTAAWEISTPGYDVVAHASHCGPIRKESDARLIAAAPDLLAENERLRAALRSVVHNLDGRTEPVHPLMVQSCVEEVKRALNHAAPAAEREG